MSELSEKREKALQDKIDASVGLWANRMGGAKLDVGAGLLLGRVAQAVSDDVGSPVVVLVVTGANGRACLIGYPVPQARPVT